MARLPMRALAAFLLAIHIDVTWAGKRVAVKEVVFDSAVSDIRWLGQDQKTVLTMTAKGRLYRSTDGGQKWNDITDFFKVEVQPGTTEPFVARGLKASPADPNTILVTGTKWVNYITSDRGSSWKKIKHRSNIHTVIFHKTRPTWMLLSAWTNSCGKTGSSGNPVVPGDADAGPCNHVLYISKDLGKTFVQVQSYVVQFNWGDADSKQQDRIYFTHFSKKTGDQPKLYNWKQDVDFAYVDGAANRYRTKTSVKMGNKFLLSHGFMFVATVKDPAAQSVTLQVSSNGGATWNAAQLPTPLEEKSYTVLDTSEGAVILHVNHGAKELLVGNVYISDAQGYQFALSLENNVRGSAGDCEFDKILSLDGVFMANYKELPAAAGGTSTGTTGGTTGQFLSDDDDELEESAEQGTASDKRSRGGKKGKDEAVVRTVISFDKAGAWSNLKPPKVDSIGAKIDCEPDRCWLHLHGVTNFRNYAPFYSTENAIGIIMGTGNVGAHLRFEQDQTNTYLSRDGGLTWVESHKGAFIYEYGDHGGLVVMADDVRKTKQVVFSWNEGQNWYDFELASLPIDVDNVVTEPNATSTKFLLYGTRADTGVMYHLNFEALGQPLCKGVWAADSVSSDYETWTPSDGKSPDKCMMGKQLTYTRRKQTSECFNGETFERPVTRKNCECTQENYECDMGFSREVGSTECKYANDGALGPSIRCKNIDHFFASAYRKVVGDTCEGGWAPSKVSVPCPPKPMTKGAMSVLGSLSMLAIIMFAVTFLSQNERVRILFGNFGFRGFGDVKYSGIGFKAPESALESVGTRFDADFIEDDQDDFGDAPQLLRYTNGADNEPRMVAGAIDSASAAVPKLAKPPGNAQKASNDDDSVDLL